MKDPLLSFPIDETSQAEGANEGHWGLDLATDVIVGALLLRKEIELNASILE